MKQKNLATDLHRGHRRARYCEGLIVTSGLLPLTRGALWALLDSDTEGAKDKNNNSLCPSVLSVV